MYGDDVAAGHELAEGAGPSRGPVLRIPRGETRRAVDPDLGSERRESFRDFPCDRTTSDEAHAGIGQASGRNTADRRSPVTGAQCGIAPTDSAESVEHETDRQLGDRAGIGARRGQHGDASFGGSVQVEAVHTRGGPGDQAQRLIVRARGQPLEDVAGQRDAGAAFQRVVTAVAVECRHDVVGTETVEVDRVPPAGDLRTQRRIRYSPEVGCRSESECRQALEFRDRQLTRRGIDDEDAGVCGPGPWLGGYHRVTLARCLDGPSTAATVPCVTSRTSPARWPSPARR